MYHPPNHKQPVKLMTLADALLRTELEKERAKWYQDYLANKERYQLSPLVQTQARLPHTSQCVCDSCVNPLL